MSDFKAKMQQIRFPLGLRPRLRWGSFQRSPDSLALLRGLILKGQRGREEKGGLAPQLGSLDPPVEKNNVCSTESITVWNMKFKNQNTTYEASFIKQGSQTDAQTLQIQKEIHKQYFDSSVSRIIAVFIKLLRFRHSE